MRFVRIHALELQESSCMHIDRTQMINGATNISVINTFRQLVGRISGTLCPLGG